MIDFFDIEYELSLYYCVVGFIEISLHSSSAHFANITNRLFRVTIFQQNHNKWEPFIFFRNTKWKAKST